MPEGEQTIRARLAFELIEQGYMTQFFPDWHEPPENIIMDIVARAAGNFLAK